MDVVLRKALIVPTMLLVLVAFGGVIRRLLGVRVGPLRTLLAAVLALAVAGPLLGASAGLMAAMLLGTRGGPEVTESVTLFELFGYILLIVTVVLVLRVLIVVFRTDRS